MGLLDFFKRKTKPVFDITVETDIRRIIDNGILFEDIDYFLSWNLPVEVLKDKANGIKKFFADRAVYIWGERTILKGLKLPLSTVFWNHKENSVTRLFRSVEFRVEGSEQSNEYLELIKQHLESLLGPANSKNVTETEAEYEWVVIDTLLYLHFYEQHHTHKLHFEVSKL